MRKDQAEKLIVGQEVICSDGLGRVVEVIPGVAGSVAIHVATHVKDRGCHWDSCNVHLPLLVTDRSMIAAFNLIQEDPHQWSKRPCSTCESISSIIDQPFGCSAFK